MSDSCSWFPLTRAQIRDWVQRHADALPQTLAELSQYPMPFRNVIVATVPPDVQVALWREHVASFLGPTSALGEEQQALLRDAIAELPLIFNAERPEMERRMRALEDRMRVLLTRDQAGRIFGMLGPPEPPGGLPLPPDTHPLPRS